MSKRAGQKQATRVVREQLARERRRRRLFWTSVIAVAVLVLAGAIGWTIYASQQPTSYARPPGASSDGSGIVVGSGKVTIDAYEDFICPHCRAFEQQSGATLDQLVAQGKVRIVYHPVAYLDPSSTTKYSTRASAASGCAAEGGKFREYAKALFDNQPQEGSAGLDDDKLIEIGRTVGLGDSFASCVRDGKYTSWTAHVTAVASQRHVTGTPTVLVNGQDVNPTPEAITAAVQAAGQ